MRLDAMARGRLVGLVLVAGALVGPVAAAPQKTKPVVIPPATRDTGPAVAPTGTGAITGTVVAVDTGRPVRRVHVTLACAAPSLTLTVTTADDGAFTFARLPAGAFTLTAARPGFLDSVFGQKRPGSGRPGTPIELIDGQRMDRLSLAIARGGVIAGTITDDHGEPEVGARVRLYRWVLRTGERTLVPSEGTSADDRGAYRVPGLMPGDYVVSATSTDTPSADPLAVLAKAKAEASATGDLGQAAQQVQTMVARLTAPTDPSRDAPTGYAPVFYPGTTQPSAATPVTLGVSEERSAVDLALELVPLIRVRGVVTGGAGEMTLLPVTLTPVGTPAGLTEARTTRLAPDGSFNFVGVPPGTYTVLAATSNGIAALKASAGQLPAPPGPPVLWASAEVTADGHPMAPLALTLQPGLSVSGRLTPSGSGQMPDLTRARVMMSAAVSGTPEQTVPVGPAAVDATGRFAVTGIVPGRYRLRVSGLPGPWAVASALVNGHDAMDMPLDLRDSVDGLIVTLSDRSTTLAGRLEDTGGRPTSDFTVVVFPADQTFWLPQARRIQATRPATDGRYSVHGLPPGDYRLALVPDVEPGQWFDPDWLREVIPSALAVTLADGQTVTQDVRVR